MRRTKSSCPEEADNVWGAVAEEVRKLKSTLLLCASVSLHYLCRLVNSPTAVREKLFGS
ncbi:MAG: hypothetical protein J6C87_02420 [Bacteroides sp.]|nr:hypothetical protein [Bacteroides sp.]